jgi:hypothetical protein
MAKKAQTVHEILQLQHWCALSRAHRSVETILDGSKRPRDVNRAAAFDANYVFEAHDGTRTGFKGNNAQNRRTRKLGTANLEEYGRK